MDIFQIWVYLAEGPLLWLTATLAAYAAADWLARRLANHPFANPVLISIILVAAVLTATGTKVETYFEGAQFVHFLLGPATVALAVPLYRNLTRLRRALVPMVLALVAGSLTAVASAIAAAWALGAPDAVIMSLAPKSVTTPIAMGISERLGGLPTLTAVLVILTGILGAIALTPLMRLVGLSDRAPAAGFAVGLAAHGIGTARAFTLDPLAGTFAGVAMGLNGILTAILMPLIAGLLG